jgi:hypothetical protein
MRWLKKVLKMRSHDFVRCKFCGIHTEDAEDRWKHPVDRNGLCPRCRGAIYKVTSAAPSLTDTISQFVEHQCRYNFDHDGYVPQDLKKKYNLKKELPDDEYQVRHWTHAELEENKHCESSE